MDLQGLMNDVYSAADHALRMTSAGDRLIFPAANFSTIAGTPGTANANGVFRITFPDAATTTVGWMFVPPAIWNTMGITFYWTVEAGTGNVRWQVDVKKLDALVDNISEAVFATGVGNDGAPAAGVVSFVADRPTAINATPAAFGSVYAVQISRIGADAGDTLSGAAAASIVMAVATRQS